MGRTPGAPDEGRTNGTGPENSGLWRSWGGRGKCWPFADPGKKNRPFPARKLVSAPTGPCEGFFPPGLLPPSRRPGGKKGAKRLGPGFFASVPPWAGKAVVVFMEARPRGSESAGKKNGMRGPTPPKTRPLPWPGLQPNESGCPKDRPFAESRGDHPPARPHCVRTVSRANRPPWGGCNFWPPAVYSLAGVSRIHRGRRTPQFSKKGPGGPLFPAEHGGGSLGGDPVPPPFLRGSRARGPGPGRSVGRVFSRNRNTGPRGSGIAPGPKTARRDRPPHRETKTAPRGRGRRGPPVLPARPEKQ